MDENKVWELAQILERAVTRQEHIAKLLGQLEERVRVVEKQDDRQEERIAQMQETMVSLSESVHRVEIASTRLRYLAFGFMGILGILAVLTGVLGGDIIPRSIKAGATLM